MKRLRRRIERQHGRQVRFLLMAAFLLVASKGAAGAGRYTPISALPGVVSIDLTVERLTAGSGSTLVSNGIPLQEGQLTSGDTDNVKVLVGDVEQDIYIEELDGRHADGSLRSVLVQFNYSLTAGSPVVGELRIGEARNTLNDIAKTTISDQATMPLAHPSAGVSPSAGTHQLHLYGYPAGVALPSSPAHLIACDLVLPMLSKTARVALGGVYAEAITEFEEGADFRWSGSVYNPWDGGSFADTPTMGDFVYGAHYYDRAEAFFAHWIASGEVEWWKQACSYHFAWREIYATGNSYHYDPYHSFVEGALCYYWLTGDPEAKTCIVEQCRWYINDPVWDENLGSRHSGVQDPRNSAYALKALMACHRLGMTTITGSNWGGSFTVLTKLAEWADKMRGIGTFDNADDRYPSHPNVEKPMYQTDNALGQLGMWAQGLDAACPTVLTNFMQGGLVPDVLLKYKRWVDPTATWVDDVIKGAVDWQWDNQWVAASGAYQYLTDTCPSEGDATPAPALNYLFASNLAYVGRVFGDSSYYTKAESVAAGSNITDITLDTSSMGKQFNQQYVLAYPLSYWIYG